jgi:hypothetical protein
MAFFWDFENPLTFHIGLLATSVAATAIIVIGRAKQRQLARYPENRVLVWLSDRSYSLYLFHWPLFIVAANLGKTGSVWVLPDPWLANTVIFPLIALVLTFVLADLSYRFVELPFSSRGRALQQRTQPEGTAQQTPGTQQPAAAQQKLPSNLGARIPKIALAAVLAVASCYVVVSAPARSSIEADYIQQAVLLDAQTLGTVGSTLDTLQLEPVVGFDTEVGLPIRPSAEEDEWGNEDPIAAARANMEARLGGVALDSITVIGDSVTLGAASTVEEITGASVNAAGYRSLVDGPPLIEQLKAGGSLGEYVVIALATNRLGNSAESLQQIVDMLGPGHRLIFVTSYGIDEEFFGIDDLIRDLPNRYPWITLADWHAAINGREDLLSPDGIHCSSDEAKVIYAQTILNAIDEAREKPTS